MCVSRATPFILSLCVPWFALSRLSSDGTQGDEGKDVGGKKVGHMLRENGVKQGETER